MATKQKEIALLDLREKIEQNTLDFEETMRKVRELTKQVKARQKELDARLERITNHTNQNRHRRTSGRSSVRLFKFKNGLITLLGEA